MFVLGALKKAGIKTYNLHHINDAGLDKLIPISYKHKYYDIGYRNLDGSLFLIEVMRIL
jgi:hypothetical protein